MERGKMNWVWPAFWVLAALASMVGFALALSAGDWALAVGASALGMAFAHLADHEAGEAE